MHNRSYRRLLVLSVLSALAIPSWAQRGPGPGGQRGICRGVCLTMLETTARQSLDVSETTGLIYMREEEKLAHDVYARLKAKWNLRVFANISQSEERHADSIKLLLDRYEIPDPAANNPAGIFQNEALQTLYTDLVGQGEGSLNGALRAGATIEDLDIRDLEKAIAATDNEDLKLVYGNLLGASRNHLQVFSAQLAAAGDRYTAQYISPAALSDILANPVQPGMGFGARRNGQRGMGRGNNTICPRVQP